MYANSVVNFRIKSGGAHLYSYTQWNANKDDAWNEMDRALGMLCRGRYSIEAGNVYFYNKDGTANKGSANGRLNIDFDYTDGGGMGSTQPGNQLIPPVNVAAEIEKALSAYKTEVELKQLREENSKLKKENEELKRSDPWTRIAGRLEPILVPAIAAKFGNGAGAEMPKLGKISEDDFDGRLEKAFVDWDEPDQESKLYLIEKIAALSKTNKDLYHTARGILLKT